MSNILLWMLCLIFIIVSEIYIVPQKMTRKEVLNGKDFSWHRAPNTVKDDANMKWHIKTQCHCVRTRRSSFSPTSIIRSAIIIIYCSPYNEDLAPSLVSRTKALFSRQVIIFRDNLWTGGHRHLTVLLFRWCCN